VTPTPTPPVAGGSTDVFTDVSGKPLPSDPSLKPGSRIVATIGGYAADETVSVTLHSTPRSLGTIKANANGVVTYAFAVPADLPSGAHTLVLAGATHTVTFAFSVPAATPSLPFTGVDVVPLGITALGFIGLGSIALLATRRRSNPIQGGEQ
jgi:hypothetical protein